MSYAFAGTRSGVDYYSSCVSGTKKYYKRERIWDNRRKVWANNYVEVNCFWNNGKVIKYENNQSHLALVGEIKVGDVILTHHGYQRVLFVHVSDDFMHDILKLHTLSGYVIGLTAQHLLYDGNGKMKPAAQFKVNDSVQTVEGIDFIMKITSECAKVRSIITMNGELMVDNIRISSYSESESTAKMLHRIAFPARFIAGFHVKLASRICEKSVPIIKYLMINYL